MKPRHSWPAVTPERSTSFHKDHRFTQSTPGENVAQLKEHQSKLQIPIDYWHGGKSSDHNSFRSSSMNFLFKILLTFYFLKKRHGGTHGRWSRKIESPRPSLQNKKPLHYRLKNRYLNKYSSVKYSFHYISEIAKSKIQTATKEAIWYHTPTFSSWTNLTTSERCFSHLKLLFFI